MKKKHVLELWEARFEEILRLEVNALKKYRFLLKKYSHLLEGSRIKNILRGIMRDEARHVEIAKKMHQLVIQRINRQIDREDQAARNGIRGGRNKE